MATLGSPFYNILSLHVQHVDVLRLRQEQCQMTTDLIDSSLDQHFSWTKIVETLSKWQRKFVGICSQSYHQGCQMLIRCWPPKDEVSDSQLSSLNKLSSLSFTTRGGGAAASSALLFLPRVAADNDVRKLDQMPLPGPELEGWKLIPSYRHQRGTEREQGWAYESRVATLSDYISLCVCRAPPLIDFSLLTHLEGSMCMIYGEISLAKMLMEMMKRVEVGGGNGEISIVMMTCLFATWSHCSTLMH